LLRAVMMLAAYGSDLESCTPRRRTGRGSVDLLSSRPTGMSVRSRRVEREQRPARRRSCLRP
jgi:hypothetical protein